MRNRVVGVAALFTLYLFVGSEFIYRTEGNPYELTSSVTYASALPAYSSLGPNLTASALPVAISVLSSEGQLVERAASAQAWRPQGQDRPLLHAAPGHRLQQLGSLPWPSVARAQEEAVLAHLFQSTGGAGLSVAHLPRTGRGGVLKAGLPRVRDRHHTQARTRPVAVRTSGQLWRCEALRAGFSGHCTSPGWCFQHRHRYLRRQRVGEGARVRDRLRQGDLVRHRAAQHAGLQQRTHV